MELNMKIKGLKKVFKTNSRGKKTNKVEYYIKETDRGCFHIAKSSPRGVSWVEWEVDYYEDGIFKEFVTNVGSGNGYSCLESAVKLCEHDLERKLRLAAN